MNVELASNRELDTMALIADRKRTFLLFCDLATADTKEWLVKGLLGHGEASAFYGKPGDGKSVLVEDLCLHVAAGWPWHGRPVRRGAVVYIALERKKLVERRAIAFRERHNAADLPFAIVGGVHDFRDPRTSARIIEIASQVEEATAEPVVLICIDTLSRALAGGDENGPKDMGAIVNATSLLQQTGAHILWVPHMPLDGGERMRGHGALLGAMDTTVHVVKADSIRTATVVKANDSEEGEGVAFTLDSVVIAKDSDGADTTAPVVVPAEPSSGVVTKALRRMSDRHKLALTALTEAALSSGQPAPSAYQLPADILVVPADKWRDELFRRGVLDKTAPNPRQDFKRIRESLAARSLIGMRDENVWAA